MPDPHRNETEAILDWATAHTQITAQDASRGENPDYKLAQNPFTVAILLARLVATCERIKKRLDHIDLQRGPEKPKRP